jgi:hypothetical protein
MLTKLEDKKSSRKPYPMSRDKQSILFGELPAHLQTMALFKVSKGCREEEVCKLRWGCEIPVPDLSTRAAGVPEEDRKALLGHKNGGITSHYSIAELGAVDRGGQQSIGNRFAGTGADDLEKENGMIPRKSR